MVLWLHDTFQLTKNMNKEQVCSECKLFINEDSFGNGWWEYHQKETYCENGACEDGVEIKVRESSPDTDNDNNNLLKWYD